MFYIIKKYSRYLRIDDFYYFFYITQFAGMLPNVCFEVDVIRDNLFEKNNNTFKQIFFLYINNTSKVYRTMNADFYKKFVGSTGTKFTMQYKKHEVYYQRQNALLYLDYFQDISRKDNNQNLMDSELHNTLKKNRI